MEPFAYICIKIKVMEVKAKFKVVYSKEADDFLNHLPSKIKDKIIYNIAKAKFVRFLDCSLKLYDVPKEKRAAITAAVLQLDLHAMAASIIQKTVQQAEKGFEALTEK